VSNLAGPRIEATRPQSRLMKSRQSIAKESWSRVSGVARNYRTRYRVVCTSQPRRRSIRRSSSGSSIDGRLDSTNPFQDVSSHPQSTTRFTFGERAVPHPNIHHVQLAARTVARGYLLRLRPRHLIPTPRTVLHPSKDRLKAGWTAHCCQRRTTPRTTDTAD
jgi:hypothetical protein